MSSSGSLDEEDLLDAIEDIDMEVELELSSAKDEPVQN